MASWQPPIPAGALYSKDATALGPGLALLAWCYDRVERDGTIKINLQKAAADIGKPYGTIRDWWKLLKEGPFFASVTPRGKAGWEATFKEKWIDWRIHTHNYGDRGNVSAENEQDEQDNSERRNVSDQDVSADEFAVSALGNSQIERRNVSDQGSAYKVLHDDHESWGGRNSDELPPPKVRRGKARDPNQEHPGCLLVYELRGVRPDKISAALIAEQVEDVERWRKAVITWCSSGINPQNYSGMLDWYHHPERMEYRVNSKPQPHLNGKKPAAPIAQHTRAIDFDALESDEPHV